MKSIIEEFKGREKENENYINKLKLKDEKIEQLVKEIDSKSHEQQRIQDLEA